MRFRRLAALAIALGSLAGPGPALSATPVPSPEPSPSASGAIYVTSLPSGADVWVDGGYVGHAPLFLDGLGAGRHRVTAVKSGWLTQESDVVVGASPALESFALSRTGGGGSGQARFHGVAFAAIQIDGGTVMPDRGGTVTLPSGRHEISAKIGGTRVTRLFTVYPDTITDVDLHDGEAQAPVAHSSVVAPADDYLPRIAYRVDSGRIFVQYGGHNVFGRIGLQTFKVDNRSIEYDAAPFMVDDQLYLPLALLVRLTAKDKK